MRPHFPPRDLDEDRPTLGPRPSSEPRDLRETLARPAMPGSGAPRPTVAHFPSHPRLAEEGEDAPGGRSFRKDLLSPAVDAAVSEAFGHLGDLVLPQRDRTVEDLVKEILRPMLKDWLDKNLPDIVERLVRQEIERVSRSTR